MRGRRREVGLAGAEADDVLAGRLERLRLGVDRERGGLGDGADAARDPAHAPMVARTPRRVTHDGLAASGDASRRRAASQLGEVGEARIVREHLDHRDLQAETTLDDPDVVLLVPEHAA